MFFKNSPKNREKQNIQNNKFKCLFNDCLFMFNSLAQNFSFLFTRSLSQKNPFEIIVLNFFFRSVKMCRSFRALFLEEHSLSQGFALGYQCVSASHSFFYSINSINLINPISPIYPRIFSVSSVSSVVQSIQNS